MERLGELALGGLRGGIDDGSQGDSTTSGTEHSLKISLPKLGWKPLEGPIQRIVDLLRAPLHFHVNLEECTYLETFIGRLFWGLFWLSGSGL